MTTLQHNAYFDCSDGFTCEVDEEEASWFAQFSSKEDLVTFQRQVDQLLLAVIPKDIAQLHEAYALCNWHCKPQNAICSLEEGVKSSTWNKDNFTANQVLFEMKEPEKLEHGQLREGIQEMILCPTPKVTLPFPESCLADFLRHLKDYSLRTIEHFDWNNLSYFVSLPPFIRDQIREKMFDVVVHHLFDVLRLHVKD